MNWRFLLRTLVLVALMGCRGNDGATDDDKAKLSQPAAKDAAPSPSPPTSVLIPTEADFEAKAMTEIDEANYERELSKLERALK